MSMSSASASAYSPRVREWVALAATPGLGPTRSKRLLERFADVASIFAASLTELEAAGLPAVSAQAIALGSSLEAADAELDKAQAAGARLLVPDDPIYPRQLLEIYDPPPVLYVVGDAETLSRAGIAIVGTRHPTPYGIGMAERLACDLAARGLIIFSGMARGVDSAAHRGAVNAEGKTVAVFGTGVDVIYPRENRKLAEQILVHGGALVSEFPIGTAPAPQNFPIRNRVISGLAYGVLVAEAGEYSGTRITARCALEQGREVFAVPGNVTNKLAWGPNTLIKQGAKLVATWEDVWEELPAELRSRVEAVNPAAPDTPKTGSLFEQPTLPEGNEKKVFALIKSDEAIHIDELMEKLEGTLSSSEVFAALFELELSGRIRPLPGKNYVRSF
jgi:DNA processing protein